MNPPIVTTDIAALYVLMMAKPKEPIQLFRQDEVEWAKRRVYRLAEDGRIMNHGGTERGQARWDLKALHAALAHSSTPVYRTIQRRKSRPKTTE